jgi:hypothetical protein
MKMRYVLFYWIARLVEEEAKDYQRPDFRRLLSLSLRLVVELGITVHMLRRSTYIDDRLSAELYESSAQLRRLIVKIKDLIS